MRCVSTETWPAYAIVAEAIACQESLNAIVFAVDFGGCDNDACRVLRQGNFADIN